jgi:hypothetical protein
MHGTLMIGQPLRLDDDDGGRWLVLDELSGPPDLPQGRQQVVTPGHPRAFQRLFVHRRESGRLTTYALTLHPSERGNVTAPALRQQLDRALRTGPDLSAGAVIADFVASLNSGRNSHGDTPTYP